MYGFRPMLATLTPARTAIYEHAVRLAQHSVQQLEVFIRRQVGIIILTYVVGRRSDHEMHATVRKVVHALAAFEEEAVACRFGQRIFGSRFWIDLGVHADRHQLAAVVRAGIMILAAPSPKRSSLGSSLPQGSCLTKTIAIALLKTPFAVS